MQKLIKPCPNCHKDDAVVITQMHYGVPRFRCECIRCHITTNVCYTKKGARRSWNRISVHKKERD